MNPPGSSSEDPFSPPPSKAQHTTVHNDSNITTDSKGQVHSSLSVNIDVQHSNQNQIKLTVNSTIQTGASNSTGATHSVETNICKQEPKDENPCSHTPTSPQRTQTSTCTANTTATGTSNGENIPASDVDIEALLNTLRENLPDTVLSELDKEEYKTLDNKAEIEKDLATIENNQRLAGVGQESTTKPKSGPAKSYGSTAPGYETTPTVNPQQPLPNMGGMAANTQPAMMPGYPGGAPRPPVNVAHNNANGVPGAAQPSGAILGDTGPAAETLKQLAAQHQNQEVQQYESLKTSQMNYDGFNRNSQGQYNGYPNQQYPSMPGMPQQQPGNGMYYNNQSSTHMNNYMRPNRPMSGGYDRSKDVSYNSTKPLTHYPNGEGQPQSSLQQLQNQVQSHFSQSAGSPDLPPGHLQISQQMNMTHNGQRMQLSQSQQVDIQNSQNISAGQQQSFQMGGATGNSMQNHQYMTEHMYKQQQQQRNPAGVPNMPHPGADSSNMGYMHRPPPPDYKPPSGFPNASNQMPTAGANTSVAGTIGSTASGTTNNNPLETMQNMVNQTSPVPSSVDPSMFPNPHMGRPMKQEPGTTSEQMHRTSPLGSANPPVSTPNQLTMSSASRPTATSKCAAPAFTSAIMKNQRAPNVNVGPHGLNISQQRVPHMMDWSHRGQSAGMTPMSQSMMAGTPSGHMGMHQGHHMHSSAHRMMQYGGGAAPGYHNGPSPMMHGMSGSHMRMAQPTHPSMIHSSQHQNMVAMSHPSGPGGSNMMHMQQHQQHMPMHQSGNSAGMIQPGMMPQGQGPTSGMPTGAYPSHGMGHEYNGSHQDHYMSSSTAAQPQPGAAPPYMDMMQQQQSNSSEFIDEILGNKPC